MSHNILKTRIGPNLFVSSPVATDSGHVRSYADTAAWLKELLRRVPITRVTNVTPLDSVHLPVWSAVTPLAKDLIVHSGKGRSSIAARLSAIMEAIERVCAETVAENTILVSSYSEIAKLSNEINAANPQDFDLPFETVYTPDLKISWVPAYELMAEGNAYVPLDLVISPARENISFGVDTNGLAAGNNHTEAVVHALYELIERDAVSQDYFFELYGEPTDHMRKPINVVDASTLPLQPLHWLEHLGSHGLRVVILDLTSELRVPVFGCIIFDPNFPGAEQQLSFAGYGADLDAERAVFRAITEAVQAHALVTVGSRDTFEGMSPIPDRPEILLRRLEISYPRSYVTFSYSSLRSSSNLLTDLQTLLGLLRSAGLRKCYVVDLTRTDLQVPVVRVLVPGLAGLYGATKRRPPAWLLARLS